MITKQFTSDLKEHHFLRVDTYGGKSEMITFSIAKAKQIIDEQGDRMLDGNASVSTYTANSSISADSNFGPPSGSQTPSH